jgi:ABC-type sugar transport system ATPase subunit
MSGDLSLRAIQVEKRFGGVRALQGVTFELSGGEIHALLGENGAGKSTLMHLLAGVYAPDSGHLEKNGTRLDLKSNLDAQRAGIAMVYQERSLFGPLTITENIFASRQPADRLGIIDRAEMHRQSVTLLRRVGLDVDPALRVEQLSSAQQQLVEIAKALSLDAQVLILDEPTAALTPNEAENLFQVMRTLSKQGVALVFISHRLEEVFALSDRITILKDGRSQGTFPLSEMTPAKLLHLMVGREFQLRDRATTTAADSAAFVSHLPPGPIRFRTDQLCDDYLRDVCIQAHAGEVVALAGLVGAGRTEWALSVFGARPSISGTVLLDEKVVEFSSPAEAIENGIAYLSEDRKTGGLFLSMSIAANVGAAAGDRFGKWWHDPAKLNQETQLFRDKLGVVCRSVEEPVGNLSGGNQQKVALAKWLLLKPKVLIVDEPTRGVDVAAKAAIHDLLRELAGQGVAVIVISSDLPEVLMLADRIYVMAEGMIAGQLAGETATEEQVIALASRSRHDMLGGAS